MHLHVPTTNLAVHSLWEEPLNKAQIYLDHSQCLPLSLPILELVLFSREYLHYDLIKNIFEHCYCALPKQNTQL